MDVKQLGGEFALIEALLARRSTRQGRNVVVPAGDDASVLRVGNQLLAVTVDSFTEGHHFSFDYCAPESVGKRVLEAAASDIVAMGGKPEWAWISLAVPLSFSFDVIAAVYRGMDSAAIRTGMSVEGGETIASDSGLSLSITVLGTIESENHICTRSGAGVGDLVCVSGPLGGSAAGLLLLQREIAGFTELKQKHLEPECRLDIVDLIAESATAMIDISDGLSSELLHIATQSNVSIEVDQSKIALTTGLLEAAGILKCDALDFALDGGEDFELLYTVRAWEDSYPGAVIGRVVGTGARAALIAPDGGSRELSAGGYNHLG